MSENCDRVAPEPPGDVTVHQAQDQMDEESVVELETVPIEDTAAAAVTDDTLSECELRRVANDQTTATRAAAVADASNAQSERERLRAAVLAANNNQAVARARRAEATIGGVQGGKQQQELKSGDATDLHAFEANVRRERATRLDSVTGSRRFTEALNAFAARLLRKPENKPCDAADSQFAPTRPGAYPMVTSPLPQTGGDDNLAEQAEQAEHDNVSEDEASVSSYRPTRCRASAMCGFLVVVAIAIGLGVSLGRPDDSAKSPDPNCRGAAREQCSCGDEIVAVSDEVQTRYTNLIDLLVSTIYANGYNEAMGSCSLQNQAMMHVAESAVQDDPSALITRYLLTYIYLTWDGDAWSRRDGWLSSDSECNWFGVTCVNNVASGLDLSQNGLEGPLVREVFLLYTLDRLVLDDNPQLTGSLPTEIGLLTNLVHFTINDINRAGTFPTEIGKLSLLQTLDSTGKLGYMEGTLPSEIGMMSSLRVLRIQSAGVGGAIPSELGLLTEMTELFFNGCSLDGTLPTELYALSKLVTLDILFNSLTGTVTGSVLSNFPLLTCINLGDSGFVTDNSLLPALLNYTNAIDIDVRSMDIEGFLEGPVLARMSNLEILNLLKNRLQGTIPTEIGLLSRLDTFKIASNFVRGELPTELGLCSNLKDLVVRDTDLTGTVPEELLKLSKLESIQMGETLLTGSLSSGFCQIAITAPCGGAATCGKVDCPKSCAGGDCKCEN